MNADAPEADAVVVRNDSILYVGDAAGAEPFIGESTDVRDLGGQLVLPGFIDTHSHLVVGGGYATALSLETWGTVDDWVQAIADYAAANEDAPLLFGYGFLATTFGPVGPTRLFTRRGPIRLRSRRLILRRIPLTRYRATATTSGTRMATPPAISSKERPGWR
jgi:hypothetical protein